MFIILSDIRVLAVKFKNYTCSDIIIGSDSKFQTCSNNQTINALKFMICRVIIEINLKPFKTNNDYLNDC